MALSQRRPMDPLIVHSDRGRQFVSAAYRHVLAQHGLTASMARKGNCYDNAFIESFFSSLKYELVYHHRFATLAEARTAIFNYIETFYNRTRIHSSLDYQSPTNFESKQTQIYPLTNCPRKQGKPSPHYRHNWVILIGWLSMARPLRIQYEGAIYHLMSRGV